ncbi:hypothetical protein IQ26_02236 [Mesorhizobium tianshanense]|uniref:Uncharacterized protein n=1 Tax=Mesorhizobium tianshanense TaxID=39844 RepID=A0A562P3A7_9HYPH|nr:hypothetical protein IQ26_02236 [Mesorhizobium tianshanense]
MGRKVIETRCKLVELNICAPVRKMGDGVELVFDRLRRDARGEASNRDDERPVFDRRLS